MRRTAAGAGIVALTAFVGGSTVLPTPAAWASLTNPVSYTCRSIAHILTIVSQRVGWDDEFIATSYERVAQMTFALGASALWFRRVRSRPYPATQFVTDVVMLTMAACLFVVRWVPWWYASLPLAFTLYDAQSPRLARAVQVYAVTSAITLHVGCGLSVSSLAAALIAIGATIAVFLAPRTAERLLDAIDSFARKSRGVPTIAPRPPVGDLVPPRDW